MRLKPAPTVFEIDTRGGFSFRFYITSHLPPFVFFLLIQNLTLPSLTVDSRILSPLLARLVASTTPSTSRREFFTRDDATREVELELGSKLKELELELPLLLIGGEPVSLRSIMPSYSLEDSASDSDADVDADSNADDVDVEGRGDAKEAAPPTPEEKLAASKARKDKARVGALEDFARRLRAAGAVPQPVPKRRKGGK